MEERVDSVLILPGTENYFAGDSTTTKRKQRMGATIRHLTQLFRTTAFLQKKKTHREILLSSFLCRNSTSNSSHFNLFTRKSPFSSSFIASMSNSASTNGDADTISSPPPESTKTVRVVVKGRVQGVFYRNWTVENARELGLNGWVRNRRDGSVEALFSGDSNSVHEMEQRCRRGPRDAVVTNFQVFPSNEDPGQGFHRHSTF